MILYSLIIAAAWARPPVPAKLPADKIVEKAEFKPSLKGLKENGLSDAHVEAMVKTGSCVGPVVSDQGHVMTASHCLERCVDFKNPPKLPFECDMEINGETRKIRVLAANLKCPVNRAITDNNVGGGECKNVEPVDLAVYEVVGGFDYEFKCLELADAEPAPGEKLFTLGTPIATKRPRGANSTGQGLAFSKGELREDENCIYQGFNSWDTPRIVDIKGIRTRQHFGATIDAIQGSSGGPAISFDTGKIVGVMSYTHPGVTNASTECNGAAFFQKVSNMHERFKSVGAAFNTSLLKCKDKKVPFTPPANGGKPAKTSEAVRLKTAILYKQKIRAYRWLYEFTQNQCGDCALTDCACKDSICAHVQDQASRAGMKLEATGHRLRFIGCSGCVVPPHLRETCTIYLCEPAQKKPGFQREKYERLKKICAQIDEKLMSV